MVTSGSTIARGYSNNMTRLLDKVERKLGVRPLNLKDELAKDKWPENVIIPDTLTTFSRYIQRVIDYDISRLHPKKDGYFYIDEDFVENNEILGASDIAWPKFSNTSLYYQQEMGYGTIDYLAQSTGFSMEDIAMLQMRADMSSLFNNGIFVSFEPPSRIALKGRTDADLSRVLHKFALKIFIKHDPSLVTIPATKMEIFEELAVADVAAYLYNELKYFEAQNTVYANIDMKLGELQEKMNKRDDIIERLAAANVSASNPGCPIIMSV